MSEWRPIETAPKDGKCVLVSNGRYVEKAWWNTDPRIWDSEDDNRPCWTVFEPEDYYYAIHLDDDPPTHWMPLPEPPK